MKTTTDRRVYLQAVTKIVLLLVMIVNTANFGVASECDEVPLPLEYLRTPFVFVGKVSAVEEIDGRYLFEFEVNHSFKDSIDFTPIVDVEYINNEHSNAKLFGNVSSPIKDIGQSFIIFAFQMEGNPPNHLKAGICSRSTSKSTDSYHSLIADLFRFQNGQNQYLKAIWFEGSQLYRQEKATAQYDKSCLEEGVAKSLRKHTSKSLFFLHVFVTSQGTVKQIQPHRFEHVDFLQQFHVLIKVPVNKLELSKAEELLINLCKKEFKWNSASVGQRSLNSIVLVSFEVDLDSNSLLVEIK
ncbi:MAG: hypothetical protein AAGJ93_07885 [Bacteroidota bacterium]